MTDFLQFVTNLGNFYSPLLSVIERGVIAGGANRIIDLASGGGGGLKSISIELREQIPTLKITLTDLYPNITAFNKMKEFDPTIFDYFDESVSALDVPQKLKGLRTMFLSFHHFIPEQATSILENAVRCGSPIFIAEAQNRDILHVLKNAFSPIMVLLTCPFIRPFSFGRLIFTYLIPLVPLFVFWDGIISVLRTYSPEELKSTLR